MSKPDSASPLQFSNIYTREDLRAVIEDWSVKGKFHFTVPKSKWKCDDLRVSGVLEARGEKTTGLTKRKRA